MTKPELLSAQTTAAWVRPVRAKAGEFLLILPEAEMRGSAPVISAKLMSFKGEAETGGDVESAAVAAVVAKFEQNAGADPTVRSRSPTRTMTQLVVAK